MDVEKKKLKRLRGEYGTFDLQELYNKEGEREIKTLMLAYVDLFPQLVTILNRMDGVAVHFLKGIADEDIGFAAIGSSFVNVTEELYIMITFMNDEEDPSWGHIQELYKLWKQKSDKNTLTTQKNKISNNLAKIKIKSIKPIGTI